jgi:hypothetical protein
MHMENATATKTTYLVTAPDVEPATVTASSHEELWAQVDRIMAGAPAGAVPNIQTLDTSPPAPQRPQGGVSAAGKARAEADEARAREAGFAPRTPLYATGTRVNEWGVDNARASRRAWSRMPHVSQALADLAAEVDAEVRHDREVDAGELRFDKRGHLVLPGGERVRIESPAFGQLCDQLKLPKGAKHYLAACDPELRARNANQWLSGQQPRWQSSPIKLRLRNLAGAATSLYAAVGTRYQDYDTNVVARQLADALADTEGRAEVYYDGRRFQADILWHSDVQPEHYVAGEFFKAGLRVRSNDAGGGSLSGSAMLWRNLCLNLIILDESHIPLFRLRHAGLEANLHARLGAGIQAGLDAVDGFIRHWDAAREDALQTALHIDTGAPVGDVSASELVWGLFMGAQAESRLPVSRGQVKGLMEAWEIEPELNRAGLVNAATRYAQRLDPFQAHELEQAAGTLLTSHRALSWAPSA